MPDRTTCPPPALLALGLLAAPALAQDTAPPPIVAARMVVAEDQPDPARADYRVPDLPPDRKLLPSLGTSVLTVRSGLELILDQTLFGQDATSVEQVGRQTDLFEVRSASIDLSGEAGLHGRLRYKLGIEYNGFDVNPEQTFAITDFNVGFALPRQRTTISVGQMREDFGYEVIGSTATMPQSERVLTPFSAPINTGVKFTTLFGPRDRNRLAVGLFKDEWGDGDGRPAVSARLSGLVIDQPDQRRFLHLAVAVRHARSNGVIRYRGRPGVAAADDFVDTGEFAADSATHIGFEAHWSAGPWSLIAEHATAYVDASAVGDPRFTGFYLLGSWVPTGESRRYDRSKGVADRIVPQGRWGAPELVVRLASVELNGGGIEGGRFRRAEAGVNWWATSRWKFGMLYGHVWLDRFGTTGRTNSLLTRIQWVN